MFITQVIGDLNIEGTLKHGLGHLGQQPLGPSIGVPEASASANNASTAAGGNTSESLLAASSWESDRDNTHSCPAVSMPDHHSGQTPYTVNETRPSAR